MTVSGNALQTQCKTMLTVPLSFLLKRMDDGWMHECKSKSCSSGVECLPRPGFSLQQFKQTNNEETKGGVGETVGETVNIIFSG